MLIASGLFGLKGQASLTNRSKPMTDSTHSLNSLKDSPFWVAYRLDKDANGKLTKRPIDPYTGRLASTRNTLTWGTHAEALERAKKDNLPGIGIILGFQMGSGYLLYAIDLDSCRNPDTGEISAPAREVVKMFASYTEISPSGRGLKIFFRSKERLRPAQRKRFGPSGQEIKIMGSGTYSTVTGNWVDVP